MFHKIFLYFRSFLNQKGQGMVEYALILAAVAIIAVVAIWGTGSTGSEGDTPSTTSLQTAVTNAFTTAAQKIDAAQQKE